MRLKPRRVMCGICGQINWGDKPADQPFVRQMADALTHRGPDSEGFHFDGSVGLGHRRLSIIDLTDGGQPMTNEDRTVWIVSNSEIYNYVELREELAAKGHAFRTRCDTEVIVHLYEEMGERCVERLDGMFAFCIWDSKTKTLFLARDRFGIKPLYYYHDEGTLLFASEAKALLSYPGLDKSLDSVALDQYLSSLYVGEPRTIFKSIRKLPPAHYMLCRDRDIVVTPYWDISFGDRKSRGEKEYAADLQERLSESVRLSLESDVPVGVFLSGGVDSSAVAAMASRHAGRIKTFSVGFKERPYDETSYSRLVAKSLGTDHHELLVTKEDAVRAIPKIAEAFDEPFADSSSIPTYYVSQLARQHVKVVLTGDGGDELFAGYPWHAAHLPDENGPRKLLDPAAQLIFDAEGRRRLYAEDFVLGREADLFERPGLDIRDMKGRELLDKLLYVDLKNYLPSDMLVKVDRMSMLNSLEARTPLLNHPFAEFAATIPAELKFKNGIRKYIFKKALRGLVPPKILNRPKMGFSIPMDMWLWEKGTFREMVYEVLTDPATRRRGYFNSAYVDEMMGEHDSLRKMHGHRLWTLFAFESWHRRFLDGSC